ncbi:pre-mRNA splicing factor (Prp24), putative [Talaromyces stipitatus ATCC 10500]|uniref:U4/U6 snRNA-associated-splicing factor PRP24 n=1 Tax=Talaromyces stipitatus (strain ATCC 10500 / CBS 375.48 / QM 6759 / NRRL 1006) TaxID=441959 RepID=B8M7G3_TALSN|nr:pre-mRNA splicing factor (Prp24), putative [Talaromyces stipitatus ATCC 10500]EED20383.1 pre-mRNA splicing factor (Prp24), putative [Talaromyces stipitatus ATCC 10500]
MDINSLLSPQESAAQSRQSNTQARSNNKSNASANSGQTSNTSPQKPRRGRAAGSKYSSGPSPVARQALKSRLPDRAPNTPASSNNQGNLAGKGNGSMTALAEAAALQGQSQSQSQSHPSHNQKGNQTVYANMSISPIYPNPKPVKLVQNPPRAPEPREYVKRNFSQSSLPPEAQQQANQLWSHIQANPHSYESHVQFIQLLHTGFVNHVYPPHDPDAHGDPRTYDLLKDLRSAREDMDKLFAMGEDLWVDWIQDETMIAQSVDERIAVMELCRRAVDEEYGSTKLWTMFGEWMLYLYNSANGQAGQNQWSEEDRIVGREVFNWPSVFQIWQRAAEATRWRIHDSHLVWSKFLDLCVQDVSHSHSNEKAGQVRAVFESRLQTPHAAWDESFQIFSGFISQYFNANYEEIMANTVARAADAKANYAARQDFEQKVQRALESKDRNLEWAVYSEYIEWELLQDPRKNMYNPHLINALYQRALLRFPTDVAMWEDCVMFLIQPPVPVPRNEFAPVLPTIERATRHCPWSGSLWSQCLLVAEREGLSFDQIVELKHRATSTGLLDAGGLEEVIKVHSMWCSYLRRRAFLPDAIDEDLDVAEVGIRSAIERVQELGENKFGKAYQGDPYFRLERIYTRYLSESGSWDSAREYYKGLIATRGNSYEFWLDYYNWEIMSWRTFVEAAMTPEAARRTPSPSYATGVLKQAIRRPDLDWPEKIMSKYIAHCEDYEDADELQEALVEIQKAMKAVARRRQKEALELAATQQSAAASAEAVQAVAAQQIESESGAAAAAATKRKREDDSLETTETPHKKARSETISNSHEEQVELKRDREHSSVMVKRMPSDVTESQIRQFFRDCGPINDIKFLPSEHDFATAIVEFDSKEDAAAALTRDQKRINGQTVDVEMGSGSTVYVTNFPPTADEAFIRSLFSVAGEIIEVRFPSLKYNTHRRFCYVQFKSADEAIAATKLDNKVVGDGLNLQVKISDPSARQDRHGPIYEEREIHVSNIHFDARENDLKELFSRYGTIETVRIPSKVNGEHRGFGFIVFSKKEEATAALAMHKQEFRGRPLQVKVSTPAPVKRAATVITPKARSESAEPTNSEGQRAADDRAARTLGLMNIPDTVNDSRIRAITEPFGPLVKIVLRPDREGAIVEFVDIKSAGRASLELEGHEITPGWHIQVGTANDVLKRNASSVSGPAKPKTTGTLMPQVGGPIKRPTQPGVGRRGGLGFKRGGSVASARSDEQHEKREGATEQKSQKTNDDFRAMFSNGRQ